MKEVIKEFILKILINRDKSFNKQKQEIKSFLLKINKLKKPRVDIPYKIESLIKNDNNIDDFIYGFIKSKDFIEYDLLIQISEEISSIIQYNENIKVFKKYN